MSQHLACSLKHLLNPLHTCFFGLPASERPLPHAQAFSSQKPLCSKHAAAPLAEMAGSSAADAFRQSATIGAATGCEGA